MEGPISFWGYKEQESNLILPEHDDDGGDDESLFGMCSTKRFNVQEFYIMPHYISVFCIYLTTNSEFFPI